MSSLWETENHFFYEAGWFLSSRRWPHTHAHVMTDLTGLTGLPDTIFGKKLQEQSRHHCGSTPQILLKQRGPMNSINLMFSATVLGFLELSEILSDGAGDNNAAYRAVGTQVVDEYDSEKNNKKLKTIKN